MPPGQCTLSADQTGRILDRLAGLEYVIRPELIQQAFADTHCVDSRQCRLTHQVVFWIVLAMGLFTDVPIRQVFNLSRRLRFGEHSPHRSSLCAAANDAAFGRPGGGRGDGAFPQIHKLSLVELGTHAELGLVLKAHRCNERTMVAGLLDHLTLQMLLLLNKAFLAMSCGKS